MHQLVTVSGDHICKSVTYLKELFKYILSTLLTWSAVLGAYFESCAVLAPSHCSVIVVIGVIQSVLTLT